MAEGKTLDKAGKASIDPLLRAGHGVLIIAANIKRSRTAVRNHPARKNKIRVYIKSGPKPHVSLTIIRAMV